MANNQTIQITLKAVGDMSDVLSNVKQLQNVINQLKLPDNLKQNFIKLFSDVEKNGEKAAQALNSGFKTKGDVSNYAKNLDNIVLGLNKIQTAFGKIDPSVLQEAFSKGIDPTVLKELNDQISNLENKLVNLRTDSLDKISRALKIAKDDAKSSAKSWGDFSEAIRDGDIDKASKALATLQKSAERVNKDTEDGAKRYAAYTQAVELLKQALNELTDESSEYSQTLKEIQNLTDKKNNLGTEALEEGARAAEDYGNAMRKTATDAGNLADKDKELATSQQQVNSELDHFKQKITYFFGAVNAVNLLKRAIRSAYNTIKDLDKVMTETAVVTSFDVGDMWNQLPEYTKRANELGVSIHDAYEAATLYYQQGLKTNEVMAVSNETLKMARIAGLGAAEATDRMTNALRGFNMQITEANAQNINDVYSNLAAKTASNVDEISTAMTKVASLANNANMSFENTAAFLSQIIETTRESAETAGTALKTVIARFSEVKSLYSEGELLGDVEGEEIDVNKVSKALRTAGINLNEYLTGIKGLDEIFMELSAKWDSLDQVQQRYIATMAAGSRQQSRFIALMQDNARMTELVKEANNATGASQEQFNKTLESLQSKLEQLKNAWNTFLMGITNSEAVKFLIDRLTDLISLVNKLTEGLTGIPKSLANIGIAFGAFKIGRGVFDKLLGHIGKVVLPGMAEVGKKGGQVMLSGITESTSKIGKLKKLFTVPKIDTSALDSYNAAINQAIIASKNLAAAQNVQNQAQIALQMSMSEAELMGGSIAAEEIALEEATKGVTAAELEQAAANKVVTMSLEALGLSQAEVNALNKLNLTDKEKSILLTLAQKDATLRQALAEGALTEEQARELIAQNMINKGKLAQIVYTKASTIATKAETGSIWQKVAAWIADKIAAESAFVAELAALGILGLIIAAVVALIALIAVLVKAVKNSTPEAKLKAAQEAAQAAAEAANEAAEAYENLGESLESLGDKYKNLDNLVEGTREWRDAIFEINQQVLELIKNYPALATLVTNKNGVLTIDINSSAVQNVMDQYLKQSMQAANVAAAKNIDVLQKQANKDYDSLYKRGYSLKQKQLSYSTFYYNSQEATEEVAKKIASGELRDEEAVRAYAKKNNISLAISSDEYLSETIEALRSFGLALLESEKQVEAYSDTLAANAIQYAGLTGEVAGYATNFLDSNQTKAIVKEVKDNIDKDKSRLKTDSAYQTYWNNVYGTATIGKNGKVTYIDSKGDQQTIDADLARERYAAAKATEEMAEAAERFALALNKTDPALATLQRLYGTAEGQGLTQADINEINEDGIEAQYKKLYGIDPDVESEEYKRFEAQIKRYLELGQNALNKAREDLDHAFGKGASEEMVKNLTGAQATTLSEVLTSVLGTSGETAAKEVNNLISKIGDKEIGPFIDALGMLKLDSVDDVQNFEETLEDLGLNIDTTTEDFQDLKAKLLAVAEAAQQVNVEKIQQAIEELQSIRAKFAKDEATRTWTDKEFEAMQKYLPQEILSDFVQDVDGNYVYLGNSMDDLKKAIEDNTAALRQQEIEKINDQITARDILGSKVSYYKNKYGYRSSISSQTDLINFDATKATDFEKQQIVAQYLQALKDSGMTDEQLRGLGLGISAGATIEDIVKSGKLDEVLEKFIALATNTSLESMKERLENENAVRKYDTYTNIDDIIKESTGVDSAAYKALQLRAINAGVTNEEFINGQTAEDLGSIIKTFQEATKLGFDTTQLEEYATQLGKVNEELANDQELALRVALANTKLNSGLSEIISSYKDWTELIDKNGKIKATSSDEVEIFNKLKKSVNEMLNTSEDLSDAFWDNKTNIELIKEAAEGSAEAIGKLQKIATSDFIKNLEISDEQIEKYLTLNPHIEKEDALQEIQDLLIEIGNTILENPLPKMEAGVEVNEEEHQRYLESLYEMMQAAGMSAEQIKAAYKDMGYIVEVTTKTVKYPKAKKGSRVFAGNLGQGYDVASDLFTDLTYETVEIPQLRFVSTGSGGGGVSTPNITAGQGNKPSSSSSGSSGSSSKPSYWKNPYDELFNLQERINEALREREALERRYQKLLKSSTASLDEIRRGYREQIAHLKTEIELQRQLAQGRLNQIHNLANQYYTDSEGNRRTYASLGVTQYAHYDENTGLLQIDWDRLEQIANDASRTAEGEAAEAYINALQELVSSYEDVRDAIWDIEDQIEDLNKELIESYTSFEDRVMDALIARYEREIDSLEKINETINDATSKMIDNIQKQIDAQRQERENAKTEEEIAQMEARLAYLRQDTSGANSLEIMQLEKDLEEARQNYEDSLIDQALQQMRDDADVAAEQRAQQIQIMREQLDMAIANGELWDEVYTLIGAAWNKDGTFDINSDLVKLLQATDAFQSLSEVGQQVWLDKLIEQANTFVEGIQAVVAEYWEQLTPWLQAILTELGADPTPINGNNSGGAGGSGGSGSPGGPGTGGQSPGGQTESPPNTTPPPPLTPQQIFENSISSEFPYGKASATYGTIKEGSNPKLIKAVQFALKKMGYRDMHGVPVHINGVFDNITREAVEFFQTDPHKQPGRIQMDGKVGNQTRNKFRLNHYKTGGLADFTGPAWLDGTKTHPEMVLNAQDTQNLIALKDTLAKLLNSNLGTSGAPTGDAYFDIDINADIASDYDVQQLASEVKRQITQDLNYRNVNSVNFIR